MLVSWVRCTVTDRPGFSAGQAGWGRLREVPGFLGRCGGWDRDDRDTAHVFGFWTDRFSYHDFLAGEGNPERADTDHGRGSGRPNGVVGTAGESASTLDGTFEKASVRTFMRRRDLSGGFQPRPSPAALLRVTYCRLRDGRFGNVIERYNRMWEPKLAVDSGMLGGFLAEEGNAEVLVFSRWRAFGDHEAYAAEIVERAGKHPPPPPPDLATVERYLVDVVGDWSV